jgi:hypothetical protein
MLNNSTRAPGFAALALLALIAGCEKRSDTDATPDGAVASDSSREGSAMVRLVNAVPSASPVDVFADDAPAFSGIAFKTVTPYETLKDNLVTLELRASGAAAADSTEPLAQNREMLSDGDRYTVVVLPAAGDNDKPTLRVLEEPTDAGDAGKARLRVVNAARGVETFDVFVPASTDPFFDDVDFATEAGFKDMDAGAGSIVIRADDGGPVLLTLPERSFEAGKTYTIILTNKSAESRQLEAVTIEDEVPIPPVQ